MELSDYGKWTQIFAFDPTQALTNKYCIIFWHIGIINDVTAHKLYPELHYRQFSFRYFINGIERWPRDFKL